MNCSFCARAGAASAATPTSDASTIPTCFLFIGSSIKNNGSRSGPKSTRGVRKVFRYPGRRRRSLQVKNRKPSGQLVGNRYGNTSTGGLVAIAVREGFAGVWDHETHTQKASTAACFIHLPGALVAFAAQAPSK